MLSLTNRRRLERLETIGGGRTIAGIDEVRVQAEWLRYLIRNGIDERDFGPVDRRIPCLPAAIAAHGPPMATAGELRAKIRATDPALVTRITGDTTGLEPVPANRRTFGEEPRDLVPDKLLGYASRDPNHDADRNNL
jgi:hypothetical protein